MKKSNLRNGILAVAAGLARLVDKGEVSEKEMWEDARALGEAWVDLADATEAEAEESASKLAGCPDPLVRKAASGKFSYSVQRLGAPYVALGFMTSRARKDGNPDAALGSIGLALLGLHSRVLRSVSLDMLIALGEGGIPGLPKGMVEYPEALLNDLKLLKGTGVIPDCLPEDL